MLMQTLTDTAQTHDKLDRLTKECAQCCDKGHECLRPHHRIGCKKKSKEYLEVRPGVANMAGQDIQQHLRKNFGHAGTSEKAGRKSQGNLVPPNTCSLKPVRWGPELFLRILFLP